MEQMKTKQSTEQKEETKEETKEAKNGDGDGASFERLKSDGR